MMDESDRQRIRDLRREITRIERQAKRCEVPGCWFTPERVIVSHGKGGTIVSPGTGVSVRFDRYICPIHQRSV